MPAGRPRKPMERQELLAKGDGIGASHPTRSHKAKADQEEVIEYAQAELVPIDSGTVALPDCVPEIPDGLAVRGNREWINIWTAGQSWLHQSEDYHLIEMVARAYDEIEIYRREIGTNYIVKGYNGQKTANPLIKEIRNAEAVILKCLSLLGFSPSDRARLGLKAVQTKNSLADLQKKTQENR